MTNFRKLHEGKANRSTLFQLINRGYTPELFQAGDWFEIDGAEYEYFLAIMPPLDYSSGAFSMCEFSTGNLTNAFIKRDGRFYCLTIERRRAADFSNWVSSFFGHIMQPA